MIKVTEKSFRGKKAADVFKQLRTSVPTASYYSKDGTNTFVFIGYYSVIDGEYIDNEGYRCKYWHYHIVEERYKVHKNGRIEFRKELSTYESAAPAYWHNNHNNRLSQTVEELMW